MTQMPNLRIIVIDDNPEIHRDFIKILTLNNETRADLDTYDSELFGREAVKKTALPQFQIDTASQGQEGLERIKQAIAEGNPYALAFVDIRMPPGWDGIETIKHIWEVDQDIQVVICTAYSDYTWEETVAHLGQRENLLILKKPFDQVSVRQLSCALTKKWQLLQEARTYTKLLEQKVVERTTSLQKSLSVTRGTLESSADAVLVLDYDNKVIDYNSKFMEMWQVSKNMLETQDAIILAEYIAGKLENHEQHLSHILGLLKTIDDVGMYKYKTTNGKIIEQHYQPYLLNEKPAGRVWAFRDVTNRALLEEKVQFQATHDSLTGLPNRVLLMDRITQIISNAQRNKTVFGVLFFDLDRFKLINDSFNHGVGDELLQEVAKRISGSIREIDTFARLGGDEFVGVVTNLSDEFSLSRVVGKLLECFKQPFNIAGHEIIVSTSIGASIFPRDGQTVEDLLRCADTAMYRAKEMGGHQFQLYTSELSKQSLEQLEVEADLHRAITNQEFFLCYQSQVNLVTNKLVSVEALIRWKHPTKGIILPIDFVPIAEETGLITIIGEWVIRAACKQNKKWQEMGLPPVRVAVNVATKQFNQPNLVPMIKNILQETGLEPKYLELELTENVIINNVASIEAIKELKEFGVSVSLDDFGTGYSSISYLRKIPVDRLKIDQSFVESINVNKGDEVLIQAIIAMAKNMDLDILAEGIETQNQLDYLKSIKCSEGQGYYFSKPLQASEFEKILQGQVSEVVE